LVVTRVLAGVILLEGQPAPFPVPVPVPFQIFFPNYYPPQDKEQERERERGGQSTTICCGFTHLWRNLAHPSLAAMLRKHKCGGSN
jgi:hypothetical protein